MVVDKTVETFARPQGERAPAAGFAQATLLQNSGDMMRKTYWQGCLKSAVIPLCLAAAVADAAGPFPFTEEWYRQRSDDPAGTRQIEKDGKLWPPYPRPVGRKQTFKHGYHSAHYWPHPYNMEDRAYVENLLAQQTASGWVMATTLHDYYFHIETQKLNEAGQNQLIWIAATAPPQFRTVYVAVARGRGRAVLPNGRHRERAANSHPARILHRAPGQRSRSFEDHGNGCHSDTTAVLHWGWQRIGWRNVGRQRCRWKQQGH